jgi:hypothetical protein
MRGFCRLGGSVLGLSLVFGLACKESAAPAPTPSALTRISGDTQKTLTGTQLGNPLTVRVNGSDGQPFQGATVTWTVTAGTATLGSPTATSDAQGLATTTVTLGATPGALQFQAAVASVTPVTFSATACDHPVLTWPDTLSATLATTDCRYSGFYTDFFELSVPTGQQGVVLTMASTAFDTYLELYLRTGAFLGFDDDIDSSNTNSQLTAILGTGDYLLAPSSYWADSLGSYTISALARPAELAGCGLVWVTRGVSVSDSVTTGDCVDTTGGNHYADVVAIRLVAGTVLKVSHHSAAFDAALFLRNAQSITVASNNDSSAATTNAYISFPVVTTGSYLLFVATNATSATGAYDLSISTATTLSGSVRRDEGPQILRMEPLRTQKGMSRRTWSRAGS